MSVDFNLVPGTPATPSTFRATNVPTGEALTMCGLFKISSYENWGQFVVVENEGAGGRAVFVEYDGGGQLKIVNNGVGEVNYWNDAYAGWAFVALVCTVANCAGFYQRLPSGIWTASPTIASPAGANNYLGNVTAMFDTDVNGQYLRLGWKLWNVAKSEAVLKNEVWSLKPRDWSGLTFWDHGLVPASCNVDRSGTGGNMTLAGAPGSSNDAPSAPFWALKGYGYGY